MKKEVRPRSPHLWLHLNNDSFYTRCLSFTRQLYQECVHPLLKRIMTYDALPNDGKCIKTTVEWTNKRMLGAEGLLLFVNLLCEKTLLTLIIELFLPPKTFLHLTRRCVYWSGLFFYFKHEWTTKVSSGLSRFWNKYIITSTLVPEDTYVLACIEKSAKVN